MNAVTLLLLACTVHSSADNTEVENREENTEVESIELNTTEVDISGLDRVAVFIALFDNAQSLTPWYRKKRMTPFKANQYIGIEVGKVRGVEMNICIPKKGEGDILDVRAYNEANKNCPSAEEAIARLRARISEGDVYGNTQPSTEARGNSSSESKCFNPRCNRLCKNCRNKLCKCAGYSTACLCCTALIVGCYVGCCAACGAAIGAAGGAGASVAGVAGANASAGAIIGASTGSAVGLISLCCNCGNALCNGISEYLESR